MKNKTKKIAFNFISDAIPVFILAIIGIVKIPLFIENLGVKTQGIYQLFSQLFLYLTLVEAGFMTAIMYMLYAPMAERDYKRINAILSGARIIFYIIAGIILLVGLILSFGLKYIIKDTDVDYTYFQFAFILFLLSCVIQYFFVAYKVIFDINLEKYKTNLIVNSAAVVCGLVDILLLLTGFDLIVIITYKLISNLIVHFIIMHQAKKRYPQLDLNSKDKDYTAKKHIKEVFPGKISALIVNNIDIVVISSFLGLKQVAIYGAYNYIVFSLKQFVAKLFASSISAIGNLVATGSEKSYKFFLELITIIFFLGTIIFVPLYMIFNSFIVVWVGSDMVLSNLTSLFFCLILVMAIVRVPVNSFITVFGMFKYSKRANYIEGALNLTFTLILISHLGILGALISTIGAYLLSDIFRIIPLYKIKFKQNYLEYYMTYIKAIVIIVVNTFIISCILELFALNSSNVISVLFSGFYIFIVNGVITYIIYRLVFKDFDLNKRIKLVLKK